MSWDAHLYTTCSGKEVPIPGTGDWNYTYNTCGMVNRALMNAYGLEHKGWREELNCLSGADGANLLTKIIDELASAPEQYRSMNPPNGWGDYDSLLNQLREMRDAGQDWPEATFYIL